MKLITSVHLTSCDADSIQKCIEEKESEILSDIDDMEDALKRDHLRMLAWMIKKEKLEIKIAVPDNPRGIEHQKYGILEDGESFVEFQGSFNESAQAWVHNHERFHVYVSWVEDLWELYLRKDLEDFDDLWNNKTQNVAVYPISDAFKIKIIQRAPKNEQEFSKLSKAVTESLVRDYNRKFENLKQGSPSQIEGPPLLFPYQKEAINSC